MTKSRNAVFKSMGLVGVKLLAIMFRIDPLATLDPRLSDQGCQFDSPSGNSQKIREDFWDLNCDIRLKSLEGEAQVAHQGLPFCCFSSCLACCYPAPRETLASLWFRLFLLGGRCPRVERRGLTRRHVSLSTDPLILRFEEGSL